MNLYTQDDRVPQRQLPNLAPRIAPQLASSSSNLSPEHTSSSSAAYDASHSQPRQRDSAAPPSIVVLGYMPAPTPRPPPALPSSSVITQRVPPYPSDTPISTTQTTTVPIYNTPTYMHTPQLATIPTSKPLEAVWVETKLLPFLFYAFSSSIPFDFDFVPYVLAAHDWASSHLCPEPEAEDIIFERVFMAVMHRHPQVDTEMISYIERVVPLTRFLVRRTMIRGPFELLGRSWVGSEVWVEDMGKRYPSDGKREGGILPTRAIMDRRLLKE